MSKQPEALRLADVIGIDDEWYPGYEITGADMTKAAAELRRQHALIVELAHALLIHHEWSIAHLTEYSVNGDERVAYLATASALAKAEAQQ